MNFEERESTNTMNPARGTNLAPQANAEDEDTRVYMKADLKERCLHCSANPNGYKKARARISYRFDNPNVNHQMNKHPISKRNAATDW